MGRALARSLAKGVTLATLGIGFVISARTERRRALHDMIAGTLVVTRARVDESTLSAGRTMRLALGVPAAAVLLLALIGVSPFVFDYVTTDHTPAVYVEPPTPLSLDDLGQRTPHEPMAEGLDLRRLSLGVPHTSTRPITPSAEGTGGSAAPKQ
jgi:hypothetical protein